MTELALRTPPTTPGIVHVAGSPADQLAADLTDAVLRHDRHGALLVLRIAADRGWRLTEIEERLIASAATRLGRLWQCKQLDELAFARAGALLERVEWSFRRRVTPVN